MKHDISMHLICFWQLEFIDKSLAPQGKGLKAIGKTPQAQTEKYKLPPDQTRSGQRKETAQMKDNTGKASPLLLEDMEDHHSLRPKKEMVAALSNMVCWHDIILKHDISMNIGMSNMCVAGNFIINLSCIHLFII